MVSTEEKKKHLNPLAFRKNPSAPNVLRKRASPTPTAGSSALACEVSLSGRPGSCLLKDVS